MALDIEIYKRNTLKDFSEIGDHVYEVSGYCGDLLDYLKTLDNSSYFKELGFGVFRICCKDLAFLKDWLKSNRSNDWRYDCILEQIENYNGELFIYANW